MARMVNCVKMGREMEGLDEPPFDGEHQEFIVQQMEAYFFGEGAEKPKDYVPPSQ